MLAVYLLCDITAGGGTILWLIDISGAGSGVIVDGGWSFAAENVVNIGKIRIALVLLQSILEGVACFVRQLGQNGTFELCIAGMAGLQPLFLCAPISYFFALHLIGTKGELPELPGFSIPVLNQQVVAFA